MFSVELCRTCFFIIYILCRSIKESFYDNEFNKKNIYNYYTTKLNSENNSMNTTPNNTTYTENNSNTSLKYTPVNNITIPTQIVKQILPMTKPYVTTPYDMQPNNSRNINSNNNTSNSSGNNTFSGTKSNLYQNSNMGIPTQLLKKNQPMTIPYTTTTPPEDLNKPFIQNSLLNNNGQDTNCRGNSVFNQTKNQNKKLMDIIDSNSILR